MSDLVIQRNLAAMVTPKSLLAQTYPWTAGGASDSITFTSTSIDRESMATGALPLSCDVEIYFAATLASGATLNLNLDLQSAPDNATWTDFRTDNANVLATGPSGGGTVTGIFRMAIPSAIPANLPGVDLSAAQRFLRVLALPHLSSTGTDTAVIKAVGILFGGFDSVPSPVS